MAVIAIERRHIAQEPDREHTQIRSSSPGHHGLDSRVRLGPVKALASLDPPVRAGGLDRALGRAHNLHLRDGLEFTAMLRISEPLRDVTRCEPRPTSG